MSFIANIISDLHPFCREHNQGAKQGLGVLFLNIITAVDMPWIFYFNVCTAHIV